MVPLPKLQLFLICACRFAEPVSFTVYVPFIFFMVRDLGIATDDTQIGYYVGIITSFSALSQFIVSIPWGMLSDRFGRRPVVLLGLASNITSLLLFGLSKSYAFALAVKTLGSLLDGNMVVLKSMIAELTLKHSESQQARAFSLLQVVFGLGSIVGSVLGGFLSNPVQRYPNVFRYGGPVTDFLNEYPYFLPCFAASILSMQSWLITYFFLEETLHVNAMQHKSPTEEEAHLCSNGAVVPYYALDTPEEAHKLSTMSNTLTRPVIFLCCLYGLVSFESIYYDELFPIWSATPPNEGGLGFDAKEIGTALSLAGVVTLLVQLFLYHRLTRRFGLLRLFVGMLFFCIIVFFLHGFVGLLYRVPDIQGHVQTKFWVWQGLLLGLAAKTLCQTIQVTSVTILINMAAPRQDALGSINGFAACLSSAMRSIGPAICGFVWSATLAAEWIPSAVRVHISWIVLACVSALTFAASLKISPFDLGRTTKHDSFCERDTRERP